MGSSRTIGKAQRALNRGRPADALLILHRRLEGNPSCERSWFLAGAALMALDRAPDAVDALRQAVALRSTDAQAHLLLGQALARAGVRAEPERCYREAARLAPTDPQPRIHLGLTLLHDGQLEAAGKSFAAALRLAPDHPGAVGGAALLLDRRGEHVAAAALLERHIAAGGALDITATLAHARLCTKLGRPTDALVHLDKAISTANDDAGRALLLHAKGDSLDAAGRYTEAFGAFVAANGCRHLQFDGPAHRRTAAAIISRFGPEQFDGIQAQPPGKPILIAGMPRTGTTLLETMLSMHPDVVSGGELEALRDLAVSIPEALDVEGTYLDHIYAIDDSIRGAVQTAYLEELRRIGGEARVIDKMPNNALHLGLVGLALPQARVLHCTRDPIDVGWSCYRRPFGAGVPWATTLEGIGHWYRGSVALMDHWKTVLPGQILDVPYEELVADPVTVMRQILAFLELPWNPACVAPEDRAGPAPTSADEGQATRIHTRSVGRAAPYHAYLEPLRAIIAS